jgi:hypothetical protein
MSLLGIIVAHGVSIIWKRSLCFSTVLFAATLVNIIFRAFRSDQNCTRLLVGNSPGKMRNRDSAMNTEISQN